MRVGIRNKLAQVDLIALDRVLREMLDLKLQLRLADGMRTAFFLQLTQAVSRGTQLSFIRLDRFELRRAFGEQGRDFGFPTAAFVALRDDGGAGGLCFSGLRKETRLVIRDVAAARRNQLGQFGLAAEHWG